MRIDLFKLSISRFFLLLVTTAALAACGGGSGGSDSNDFGGGAGAVSGPPTLTTVTISGSGSSDPAGLGDTITVSIQASETILAPSVTIAGSGADSVSGSGTQWTATRALVLGDPDGAVAISITFSDVGGEAGTTVTATTDGSSVSFANPASFQQSFSDEFSGTELDLSIWNIQLGDGTAEVGFPGWGNNELQVYAASQAKVENGMLVITADRASDAVASQTSFSSGDFISARINTRGKMDFRYGRVEARIRLPAGQGIWPAFWMLPTDDVYGPWPQSGEIDILEAYNLGVNGRQTVSSTVHYGLPFPANSFNVVEFQPGVDPQQDFHEYAMEWDEAGTMRFYFDGQHYATQTSDNWFTPVSNADGTFTEPESATAPFDQNFHILLNVAVGGNLPGSPDASTQFPVQMEVDYVRVFNCEFPRPEDPCMTNADASVPVASGATGLSQTILNIYEADAPNALTFNINGVDQTNTLQAGSFNPNGELTANDFSAVDPLNSDNIAWHWAVQGGVANTFIGSQDLAADEVLDTGFDFRGADMAGRIVFDMLVTELSAGTDILIKMDSGFPNVGQVALQNVAVGEWRQYSVRISDLIANPLTCCGGSGLNLANVLNLFVIEPTNADAANIAVDLYLDNIRVTSSCANNRVCDLTNRTKPASGVFQVFDNAIAAAWDAGISAFDSAIGFASCFNDDGAGCPSVNYRLVTSDDPARDRVIEVTHAPSGDFAGMVIGSTLNGGINLSEFSSGNIVFDINVTNAGSNASGFVMKADCVFPCTSGDQALGQVGLNGWQTVTVPVSQLIAGGLDISNVNTGLVIFPVSGEQADVVYRLDNIRWESGDTGGGAGGGTQTTINVYDDALDSFWADGFSAFDQAIGFGSCNNDDGAGCPSISWQEVAAADAARGQIIQVDYPNDAQFAGLIVGLDNAGNDLSGVESGNLVFDINVTSNPANTNFIVKADCIGCPVDAGQREQNIGTPGSGWMTVSVPVQDMINANGGPGSGGLVINSVTTGLVIFPTFGNTAGVSFQLDNIRWETDAPADGGSQAVGAVFDDALDAQWADGFSAFDQAIGFGSCNNDDGAGCPSINWMVTAAADTARGQIIDVSYPGDAQFAGLIVGLASSGVDFSAFAAGNLVFDLNVTANPANAAFIMKADCVGCPVDAGQREQNLGVPGSGWNTISVPVANMVNANGGPGNGGLIVGSVTTGLVIFPAFGNTAGVNYQLDNIRWEAN